MKTFPKLLLALLFLTGLQFALSGCETSGEVYYGPNYRDPWFRDDNWMDGTRGYRERDNRDNREERSSKVDVYISPPRIPAPPGIHIH
jgi:hypothetical protein